MAKTKLSFALALALTVLMSNNLYLQAQTVTELDTVYLVYFSSSPPKDKANFSGFENLVVRKGDLDLEKVSIEKFVCSMNKQADYLHPFPFSLSKILEEQLSDSSLMFKEKFSLNYSLQQSELGKNPLEFRFKLPDKTKVYLSIQKAFIEYYTYNADDLDTINHHINLDSECKLKRAVLIKSVIKKLQINNGEKARLKEIFCAQPGAGH